MQHITLVYIYIMTILKEGKSSYTRKGSETTHTKNNVGKEEKLVVNVTESGV